jgi:predicted phosphoribosyltransferase
MRFLMDILVGALLGSGLMIITTPFRDRNQAGELLGNAVKSSARGDVVVIGLPRGGVPVAAKVAAACNAPLDVYLVRKIGSPGQKELASGAIASGGVVVWNRRVLQALGLTPGDLRETVEIEEAEIRRREQVIRSALTPAIVLTGKTVVLVDDGVATGATMRAAIRAIKQSSPKEIIVALPVAPEDTCSEFEHGEKVKVVCLKRVASESFGSVGQWYDDFSQVETEECRTILERNRAALPEGIALTTVPPASHVQSPRPL